MEKVFRHGALAAFVCFNLLTNHTFSQMDDCSAHPDNEIMHDEHCAVFALVPEDGATHVSVASGSWFNPATWNTMTVPSAGSKVLVDSGFTVTYDAMSDANLDWVRVNGTLNFATNVNTKMKVTTFVVDPNAYMTIGTVATPVAANVTARIIFPDEGVIDITDDPFEFGKGFISHGHLTIYGEYKKAYCPTVKQYNAGATFLKLTEVPTGWEVGDVLILPGTNASATGDFEDNTMFQDEVLTITSIAGKTIYFTNNATGGNSLLYQHKFPIGYGLKMYVANTTRNVQFETENYVSIPITQRGHLMLMHNVDQKLQNASFIGMGRTNKDILVTDPVVDEFGNQLGGGANVRGRYACHVHRAGTNNILAIPVLIQGCVAFDPTSWGFVNHAGNVQIEDNVVFDFAGAGFVSEDGNELGTFKRNFAIKGKKALTVTDVNTRTPNFDFGFEGNGFWLQGSNTEYENNIAASCAGDAYKLFSDDASMPESHKLKIPAANVLNPVICGTEDSIYTAVVPMRKFKGCMAYNCNGGMTFWTHLLNTDNVGDYSTVEYDPYSHGLMSVVEDFKFWNLLSSGIQVKYSSQVEFRNGLLLGDINQQFATSEWIEGIPVGGFAFSTSTTTGQIIYNNLTVKGWKRAIVAGRGDDLKSGDDIEYNIRTSKVIGGVYNNNTYNIWPEEGTDLYDAPEYFKFPKYFEVTGSPSFTAITSNTLPIADYSYVALGGNSILFNGVLSSDIDPGTTPGAGNGVAAYVWNFGDGITGYGRDVVHAYAAAGTYSVTLTVYDSQGQTHSTTRNAYVTTEPYNNILLNSGFENGGLTHASYTNNTKKFVGVGWLSKDNWELIDGKALIHLSDSWQRPLIQIIKNEKAMQGVVDFSFQAKNTGIGASGNPLKVEIIGVNGEFQDLDVTLENNITAWLNDDMDFTSTLLYSQNFGTSEFNWQTFSANINFGGGYEYIILKFYSSGVKLGPGEEQGIDNVCLPCDCQTPQQLFEDELTSSHAMLLWDNVGSSQYQVQYKTTTGGSWTTVTVENTYYELSSLLPNTSYTWKVQAYCDGVWTDYSPGKIFITPTAGTSCTSPHNLFTSLITATKATLNWEDIPGALLYQVSYKKSIGGSWINVNTTDTTFQLNSLLPATAYQWKVKAQCAAGWKNYTSTLTFITLPLREETEMTGSTDDTFTIYPNPVTDQVVIQLNADASELFIQITDVTGQMIHSGSVSGGEGSFGFDLSKLATGVYFMTVYSPESNFGTLQFVKQ